MCFSCRLSSDVEGGCRPSVTSKETFLTDKLKREERHNLGGFLCSFEISKKKKKKKKRKYQAQKNETTEKEEQLMRCIQRMLK